MKMLPKSPLAWLNLDKIGQDGTEFARIVSPPVAKYGREEARFCFPSRRKWGQIRAPRAAGVSFIRIRKPTTNPRKPPAMHGFPEPQGLYHPQHEHDSCGVGFLCHLKGKRSHEIIKGALQMCQNMDHRGGCGCDPQTGDGAGLFFQLPDKFFRAVTPECGIELPAAGRYAVGFVFLSPDEGECRAMIETYVVGSSAPRGRTVLGWRDVPVMSGILGKASSECEPKMKQVFIGRAPEWR
jgi:hypothetical protein